MDLMWRDVVVFAAIIGLAALLNWLTSPSFTAHKQWFWQHLKRHWAFWLLGSGGLLLLVLNIILLNKADVILAHTQIIAGGVIVAYIAIWRNNVADAAKAIADKREKNERQKLELDEFAKAVAMLDEKNALSVRQSAVIMLQGVTIRSPTHTQHCIDILCGLNGWMAEQLEQDSHFFKYWLSRPIRLDDSDIHRAAAKEPLFEKARREAQVLSQTVLKSLRTILLVVSSNRDKYPLPLSMGRRYLCGIHLSGLQLGDTVDFFDAHLQYANLWHVQLQGADLCQAKLQEGRLEYAQLQGAHLEEAQLQGASLQHTQLQGADLRRAQLQKANLREAQLQCTDLTAALLQEAYLREARLERAHLSDAQLQGAYLREAQLQGAILCDAQLQGARLYKANLQCTDLTGLQLQGAYSSRDSRHFSRCIGQGSDMRGIDDAPLDDNTIAAVIAAVRPYANERQFDQLKTRLYEAKGKVFVLPTNVKIGTLDIKMAENIRQQWDWFAPIAYQYKSIEDFYIKQCGQKQWDEYQQQLRTNSE